MGVRYPAQGRHRVRAPGCWLTALHAEHLGANCLGENIPAGEAQLAIAQKHHVTHMTWLHEGESLPLATKHIIFIYIYVHIDTYVVWCSVYLYNFIYTGTYHVYLQLETVFSIPLRPQGWRQGWRNSGHALVCGASASWSSHGNLSFLIRNDEEWLSMIKKYWGWYDDEGWLWMMENH